MVTKKTARTGSYKAFKRGKKNLPSLWSKKK